ncbi:MAG: class I SAM-dependent methyltransferase [Verrucomicrobia bacterium]|nr:class I SAM-dependent methyltransferase [Verrucomicrobiota bacterium]
MTDWEHHYQQGETPWDKGFPAPPLADFLRATPLQGDILVPGCGLGHDVRAIAAAAPEARVLGLDLAPTAIDRARSFPPAGRERFTTGDLFALDPELRDAFDWVWEHTCYCAIDPARRNDYLKAVATALRPGGHLLGVFYLDPYDDDHRPGDGRPPFGTSLADLEDALRAHGFGILHSRVPDRAYPGREGRERIILAKRGEPSGT